MATPILEYQCPHDFHTFEIVFHCKACDRHEHVVTPPRLCMARSRDRQGWSTEIKAVACKVCRLSLKMYFHCTSWGYDDDLILTGATELKCLVTNVDTLP